MPTDSSDHDCACLLNLRPRDPSPLPKVAPRVAHHFNLLCLSRNPKLSYTITLYERRRDYGMPIREQVKPVDSIRFNPQPIPADLNVHPPPPNRRADLCTL